MEILSGSKAADTMGGKGEVEGEHQDTREAKEERGQSELEQIAAVVMKELRKGVSVGSIAAARAQAVRR